MIIERDCVRAILIAPAREVLLMRIREPGTRASFWITPGGGIEAGESLEDALRRELREEVGLEHFELGPLVWRRQHTFDWVGRRICQRERYHVVHVERFEPHMSDGPESEALERFHWWPVAELEHATESLTPTSLHAIVARYLAEGAPTGPLEPEILVD